MPFSAKLNFEARKCEKLNSSLEILENILKRIYNFKKFKMELDKKDICKIIDGEPERIEHVKLKKYAEEEYAESAYRVIVDGAETKYCWCAICKMVYWADKKHLMGNIRTHWNGHRSRKRVVQNTMDNFVSKKVKITISESEIAQFRRCAAQALCESALPISFYESAGAQTLFDGVQSKFKLLTNSHRL